MLLDVVEAEGEDLDDDLKKDFGPRLFFRFLFHDNYFLGRLVNWSSGLLDNLQAGFLVGGLFGKEAGGEGGLGVGRDKDAAFGVFGAGTAVEADTGTTGDLQEDGQGALETRGLRDFNFVDQGGNEVVGVFEGVADIVQTLNKEAGTLVDVVRGAIELAGNCLTRMRFGTNRRRAIFANEFVIHRSTIINIINIFLLVQKGQKWSKKLFLFVGLNPTITDKGLVWIQNKISGNERRLAPCGRGVSVSF